jgi:hypothetical protein
VDDVSVRARCSSSRSPLGFADWSRGLDQCPSCAAQGREARTPGLLGDTAATDYRVYERMLDELPPELIDELVAAIEDEGRSRERRRSMPSPVQDVIDEIGIGRSPRELPWAIWGFVGGFAGNLAIAKYAQMTTAAPMSDFLAPMLLGGLLAGATCAAIAWGVVRLREP